MSPTLIADPFCSLLEHYLKFKTPLITVVLIYSRLTRCKFGRKHQR